MVPGSWAEDYLLALLEFLDETSVMSPDERVKGI
jgi:hypothetical protein